MADAPALTVAGRLERLRRDYFGSWGNGLATIVTGAVLIALGVKLVRWAVLDAVWGAAPPEACLAARGACWAVVDAKFRLILFGRYPYGEQWRPLLAMLAFVGLIAASCNPAAWGRRLVIAWALGLALCFALMAGGVLGLAPVATSDWGGLPLTILLATGGVFLGFVLALPLALARRSRLPAIRTAAVLYIELIRGVPLISVLFIASVVVPLFLPSGVAINALLRAQLGIALFFAAYMAEIIRGGLQAVPRGQAEAAAALGLAPSRTMRLVVLPQALRISLPSMTNLFISAFKDTSLVVVISMFDLLGSARAALSDPTWTGFYVEFYVFAALIYVVFCSAISWYSRRIEARLGAGRL